MCSYYALTFTRNKMDTVQICENTSASYWSLSIVSVYMLNVDQEDEASSIRCALPQHLTQRSMKWIGNMSSNDAALTRMMKPHRVIWSLLCLPLM